MRVFVCSCVRACVWVALCVCVCVAFPEPVSQDVQVGKKDKNCSCD